MNMDLKGGLNVEEIKWNDRFNLGVETIDRAHQKLFSIVNKLIALNEDAVKQPHACREGIKYFKSYTLKHFAEEEEYMRRIAYSDYGRHKQIHDNMRDKTIPALEKELEEENYSEASVQHFMGVCIGWLNAHIIMEDRAITQKTAPAWLHSTVGDEAASLERAVIQALKKLFDIDSEVISSHYSGENFYAGNKICYRLSYRGRKGMFLQIFFAYEARQILKGLGDILGRPLKKVDRTALYAIKVVSEKFVEEIKTHFPLTDGYRLERSEVVSFDRFLRTFDIEYPVYSLLFGTENMGQFVFCVRL